MLVGGMTKPTPIRRTTVTMECTYVKLTLIELAVLKCMTFLLQRNATAVFQTEKAAPSTKLEDLESVPLEMD